MKNNTKEKRRFISTALTILVASVIFSTSVKLPVYAADNTTTQLRAATSKNQTLLDDAIKSISNNKNVTKNAIDRAQALVNKIPNNDQSKKLKDRLQSIIDGANKFLDFSSKVQEAINNLNNFIKNTSSMSKSAAKNVIDRAQQLLNKLPSSSDYNNFRTQLQTSIDKANKALNK